MTCVVGIRGRSGVLLAGDSQFSDWNAKIMAEDPKAFELSEVVAIAYCGSGRLGQILTYHMDQLDSPPLGMDEHRWAVRYFIEHLRVVLDATGHLHVWRNIEHLGASAFLLAVRGRLFNVYEDFEVLEHQRIFSALGSGDEVAIGAMAAILGNKDVREPIADGRLEEVAMAGVRAASDFTNYVGGDTRIVRTVNFTADEKALARRIAGRR